MITQRNICLETFLEDLKDILVTWFYSTTPVLKPGTVPLNYSALDEKPIEVDDKVPAIIDDTGETVDGTTPRQSLLKKKSPSPIHTTQLIMTSALLARRLGETNGHQKNI